MRRLHRVTNKPELYTVEEAAAILRVSKARCYELIRKKLLPAVSLGRQKRVGSRALKTFIESGGCSLPGGWKQNN